MRSEDLQHFCNDAQARLVRANKEHKDAIERACDNALKKGKDTGLEEGLIMGSMVGAHRCRSYLLMTPYGQAFLPALVRDLPEAFLHSEDFWNKTSVPMGFWVGAIVDEALTLLEQRHRMKEINPDKILEILEKESPTIEPDLQVNANNPWYIKSLRATTQILFKPEEHIEVLPAWEEFS